MREAWRTRSGMERERDVAKGVLTMLVCVCLVEGKNTTESKSFKVTYKRSPLEGVTASAALTPVWQSIVRLTCECKRRQGLIDALPLAMSRLTCASFSCLPIGDTSLSLSRTS
jgi:hypothetical protein